MSASPPQSSAESKAPAEASSADATGEARIQPRNLRDLLERQSVRTPSYSALLKEISAGEVKDLELSPVSGR